MLGGEGPPPSGQPTASMLVTAPERLRQRLRGLPTRQLVKVAARLRPGTDPGNLEGATTLALRSVTRHLILSEEIAELDARLERLVADAVPGLVRSPGIGTNHAATLLVLAGDNPERLKSEASFASLSAGSRRWKPPLARW
jgi:transposase